jgi:hypothetical protein
MEKYELGVYYFPNYHSDPRTSGWHGHRWTEWELVKSARPRFAGQRQPRVPLWGYEDESDPAVMARKSAVATKYGLNHWIFDWYHYEGSPFLNGCLDRGFLAKGADHSMKFALMWANHDWLNVHPARADGPSGALLSGKVTRSGFSAIVHHLIDDYFSKPNYWCIGRAPYFSIYDLGNFIAGLGGMSAARSALDLFREEAARAGFSRIHLNLINWQNRLLENDGGFVITPKIVQDLGFDSVGSYAWVHHCTKFVFPETDYLDALQQNQEFWKGEAATQSVPYFPNVSVGWDASPRVCPSDKFENRGYPFMSVFKNDTPENFKIALERGRAHLDGAKLPTKHLSINAWNEWTEGSYLEPDETNGFRYLEAIRDVFARPATKPLDRVKSLRT